MNICQLWPKYVDIYIFLIMILFYFHFSTNGGQSYPCTRPGCTRVFKVAAKLRMHDDVVHKNLEGKYKVWIWTVGEI